MANNTKSRIIASWCGVLVVTVIIMIILMVTGQQHSVLIINNDENNAIEYNVNDAPKSRNLNAGKRARVTVKGRSHEISVKVKGTDEVISGEFKAKLFKNVTIDATKLMNSENGWFQAD